MLDAGDDLSGILGWVSIACGIVVFSPQIYENYVLQSGEGLSVLFVVIWLVGDICNLVGAIAGNLLPTVILIALYYFVADFTLLAQIFYYRWKQDQLLSRESQPLLRRNGRKDISTTQELLPYAWAIIFVFGVGIMAWWIGGTTQKRSPTHSRDLPWFAQALGWTSAMLYLGARIPQILKNIKTQCEGLSPALFFFAIFGNVTYSLSICAKSIDPEYFIINAGWLAGSTLTVFLDLFVLSQVFYYRSVDRLSRQSVN